MTSPTSRCFLDTEAVEARTGRPNRSAWRSPGQPRPARPADAIAVAPASFNTVNKWAAGILNSAQDAHPAYRQSLARLRETGVLIGSYEPHRPKTVGGADRYRWAEALELLGLRGERVTGIATGST